MLITWTLIVLMCAPAIDGSCSGRVNEVRTEPLTFEECERLGAEYASDLLFLASACNPVEVHRI